MRMRCFRVEISGADETLSRDYVFIVIGSIEKAQEKAQSFLDDERENFEGYRITGIQELGLGIR